MKKFLNQDMEKYRNISDSDAKELREKFKNGLRIVRSMFDKNAFKRYYKGTDSSKDGYWEEKKFNYSLYDITLGVLCNFDSNIIYPKIVGGSLGLHPLYVFIAVTLGGYYAGILGMIASVPIAGVVKIFVIRSIHIFLEHRDSDTK